MFDVGCVTCSYRISEGFKTALSDDLQHILLHCSEIVLDQCEINLNISNATAIDCKLIYSMIKLYKDIA